MTEETKNTTAALEGSAFARVLGRLMEARGIPADQEHALELAEKSGLDRETFKARLAGSGDANPGDLSRLAGELALSGPEMDVLAWAYVYEEEREPESFPDRRPRRIPRPEEILEDASERPPEQLPSPLRCRFGSRTGDGGCPRDASTWLYPEHRDIPVCAEHARCAELADESIHWETAYYVTLDWIKMAQAWGHEDLERMATNAHEDTKEELLKAEARADLAREIANVPRKGRKERIAELTPEQDAESHRLIARSDALVTAYTVLEDAPEELIRDDARRRAMGVLAEEKDRATEEAHRFHEELGLRDGPPERPQPESGVRERSCAYSGMQ